MNCLITGGTGFIGTELRMRLLREGHIVTVVSRSPEKYEGETAKNQQFVGWDSHLPSHMEQADVVFNLAGENVFGKRWTDEVKHRIYSSRINSTNDLVEAIAKADNRPELLVSASVADYYATQDETVLDESKPPGDDFISKVCIGWEQAAEKAADLGVRVAIPRLGAVLEKGGGALQQMLLPFRLFVGGPIGSGDQYFSWIHMDDACRGLMYPMEHESFVGAYNLSSPNPVTMRKFAKTLGEVMSRPSFFRVPEFALRIVLGEAAKPITNSHRVQPGRLLQAGFDFQYEDLHEALSEIL